MINKKISPIKKLKNEKGQSTIEFILSFSVAITFLFLFLRIALNYTEGYVIHYANYMASRAFMVYEHNSNNPVGSDGAASNLAEDVFYKIFPTFDGDFEVMTPIQGDSPHFNVFVGTVATFERRFSVPMIIGSGQDLNLTSESFLGRVPTRAECLQRVCDAMAVFGVGGCEAVRSGYITLSDNGC